MRNVKLETARVVDWLETSMREALREYAQKNLAYFTEMLASLETPKQAPRRVGKVGEARFYAKPLCKPTISLTRKVPLSRVALISPTERMLSFVTSNPDVRMKNIVEHMGGSRHQNRRVILKLVMDGKINFDHAGKTYRVFQ